MPRQSRPWNELTRDERRVVEHVYRVAFGVVALFVCTFVLLDLTLTRMIPDVACRMALRWILLGATGVAAVMFGRRSIDSFAQFMRGERSARNEAEALAELAASVAAGESTRDTLSRAVQAAGRLFGEDVRCSVGLPQPDGTLRVVARNQSSVAAANSVISAPLVADNRTLGVVTAVSAAPSAFGQHEEQVLTAVARHIAVALVAAEAREAAAREAAAKAAIIEQMADSVIVCDRDRRIIDCNSAAAAVFDVTPEQLRTLDSGPVPWELFTADGARVGPRQGPLSRAARGETVSAEYRVVTRAGKERWVWASSSPLRDSQGNVSGAILVQRDMASLRRAENALRESEERYRRLVEFCPDPIVVHCDGKIVYANAASLGLAGATDSNQVVGRPLVDFIPLGYQQLFANRHAQLLEAPEGWLLGEGAILRLDGEVIQVESTTMPITYEGRPAVQAVIRDITERKRAEAALTHQALHDSLTDLPNRTLLLDRLRQAIASARREGTSLSLLLMDLDGFKEINDTLGHHAGDLLLQQVGTRLRDGLRHVDTIARLGGDEFAVLLPGTGAEGVLTVVANLLGRLQAPFTIEGQRVLIGASIGIAVSPEHGDEVDALLRRADVAMYAAKRSGSGFALYQAELDSNSPNRLSVVGDPRRDIEEVEQPGPAGGGRGFGGCNHHRAAGGAGLRPGTGVSPSAIRRAATG